MENNTFRVRLAELMQKSRRALRLYTSVGRLGTAPQSELSELQAREWKEVNADLLKQVALALDCPHGRELVADIFCLRDRYYHAWRLAESELHTKQKELIRVSENGDFMKAAVLSRELVLVKAREQASQAAHHELQEVLSRSKLTPPTIELSPDTVVPELAGERGGKGEEKRSTPTARIIPLRARVQA